jgi:hypothetical protein
MANAYTAVISNGKTTMGIKHQFLHPRGLEKTSYFGNGIEEDFTHPVAGPGQLAGFSIHMLIVNENRLQMAFTRYVEKPTAMI